MTYDINTHASPATRAAQKATRAWAERPRVDGNGTPVDQNVRNYYDGHGRLIQTDTYHDVTGQLARTTYYDENGVTRTVNH